MKIRRTVGMPEHLVTAFNPYLPDTGDGTAGGTNGGAGAPAAIVPAPSTSPVPTPPPAQPSAGAPAVGPNGFPEGTAVAEMSDSQQAAYWKFHARKHEDVSKQKDARLAELEPIGEQFRALEAASKTEHERAIEAARTEATASAREAALTEARTTYGAQLVQLRLDAAREAKGLTSEAMAALAGDTTRFLGADGLNAAALDAFLGALPDKAAAAPPVDLGGGRRTPVTPGGLQAGADLFAARHPSRKAV